MLTIKVNLDTRALREALRRVVDTMQDTRPLTRDRAQAMYDATARAFQAEQSPARALSGAA